MDYKPEHWGQIFLLLPEAGKNQEPMGFLNNQGLQKLSPQKYNMRLQDISISLLPQDSLPPLVPGWSLKALFPLSSSLLLTLPPHSAQNIFPLIFSYLFLKCNKTVNCRFNCSALCIPTNLQKNYIYYCTENLHLLL